MKELKNFLKVANIQIEKIIDSESNDLIEKNPEDYNPVYDDYGYYNNGVGMASCGGEYSYNEEKAHKDAINKIADSIQDGDIEYIDMLLDKKEFRCALAELIRSK